MTEEKTTTCCTAEREQEAARLNTAALGVWYALIVAIVLPRRIFSEETIEEVLRDIEHARALGHQRLDGHFCAHVPVLERGITTYLNTQMKGLAEVTDMRMNLMPSESWLADHWDSFPVTQALANKKLGKDPWEETDTRILLPIFGEEYETSFWIPQPEQGPFNDWTGPKNGNKMRVGGVMGYAGAAPVHGIPFKHQVSPSPLSRLLSRLFSPPALASPLPSPLQRARTAHRTPLSLDSFALGDQGAVPCSGNGGCSEGEAPARPHPQNQDGRRWWQHGGVVS